MLAEQLSGMTLEHVRELNHDDEIDTLRVNISPVRIDCVILAERIIQNGIDQYTHYGVYKLSTSMSSSAVQLIYPSGSQATSRLSDSQAVK